MIKSLLSAFIFILLASASNAMADEASSVKSQKQPTPSDDKPKQELRLIKEEPRLDTFDQASDVPLKGLSGQPAMFKLSGGVVEKNLAIEWDDWHNKFARAVESHMFSNVIETLNMPQGATMWFHCEITSDKHIKSITITKPSGDFWYDRAVMIAVYKLDGDNVLAFPANSKRTEVATDFGITMGGGNKGYIRFGDTEYRELAPGDNINLKDAEHPSEDDASSCPGKTRHHKLRSGT